MIVRRIHIVLSEVFQLLYLTYMPLNFNPIYIFILVTFAACTAQTVWAFVSSSVTQLKIFQMKKVGLMGVKISLVFYYLHHLSEVYKYSSISLRDVLFVLTFAIASILEDYILIKFTDKYLQTEAAANQLPEDYEKQLRNNN